MARDGEPPGAEELTPGDIASLDFSALETGSFDSAELDSLVALLRDCPGRLAFAVVSEPAAGDRLVETIESQLSFPVYVVPAEESPARIAEKAVELGRTGADALLVLLLDGRQPFETSSDEVAFWTRLNYARESLASGALRTLLVLDEKGDVAAAQIADDLRDWAMIFRFPGVLTSEWRRLGLSRELWIPSSEEALTEDELNVLRRQHQRARESGMPELEIVQNYTLRLFTALTFSIRYESTGSERLKEAAGLWARDLLGGAIADSLKLHDRFDLWAGWLQILTVAGLWHEASQVTERMIETARDAEDVPFQTLGHSWQGFVEVHQGKYELAIQSMNRGLATLEQSASGISEETRKGLKRSLLNSLQIVEGLHQASSSG